MIALNSPAQEKYNANHLTSFFYTNQLRELGAEIPLLRVMMEKINNPMEKYASIVHGEGN